MIVIERLARTLEASSSSSFFFVLYCVSTIKVTSERELFYFLYRLVGWKQ